MCPNLSDSYDFGLIKYYYILVLFKFLKLNIMKTKLLLLLFLLPLFVFSQITQIGADIDGEAADDLSGWSVSLSSDGSIVAIGAISNDGNGPDSGHVRIYQNTGGTWTQIGEDIDGEVAFDQSGRAVSLSADGSIVAWGSLERWKWE